MVRLAGAMWGKGLGLTAARLIAAARLFARSRCWRCGAGAGAWGFTPNPMRGSAPSTPARAFALDPSFLCLQGLGLTAARLIAAARLFARSHCWRCGAGGDAWGFTPNPMRGSAPSTPARAFALDPLFPWPILSCCESFLPGSLQTRVHLLHPQRNQTPYRKTTLIHHYIHPALRMPEGQNRNRGRNR